MDPGLYCVLTALNLHTPPFHIPAASFCHARERQLLNAHVSVPRLLLAFPLHNARFFWTKNLLSCALTFPFPP